VAALALAATLLVAGHPAQAAAPAAALDPAAQAALRDQLVASAPVGSSARVDAATGKVVLRVPGVVPAGLAATAARHAGRVSVETTPGVIGTYADIVGGHEIDGPTGGCTAGFMAVDGAGRDYALTAGHCTAGGGTWRRNGNFLGPAVGSVLGVQGDFGIIELTGSYVGQPLVNSYVTPPSLSKQPVRQLAPLPAANLTSCKMGRTSRYTCGSILAYDVTINTTAGPIGGLIETNICARPGDSGGPMWQHIYVTNPVSARAIGLVSSGTGNLECSNPANRTYFQPVGEALDWFGLSLMLAP
jgi:hypothetical protein